MRSRIETPPEKTSKRQKTAESVYVAGAREMNIVGPGAVKLGTVAKAVGMSRNALYYYVKDRAELIQNCYLRACDFLDGIIQTEVVASTQSIEKIDNLFRNLLSVDASKYAIISDLALVDSDAESLIAARLEKHVAGIAELITQGQKNGTFTQVDPTIVAHMIVGMIEWTRLWNAWTSPDLSLQQRRNEQSASALCDIVLRGLAAHPGETFDCALNYEDLTETKYNLFDRDDANAQRRDILIGTASRLFNKHGIESVSVDDIATEVGVTKGAIYHHFRDKPALVLACYERAFDSYQIINDAAHSSDTDSLRKMLTSFHLNCQAQAGTSPPLVMQPGLQSLPEVILVRARAMASQMRSIHAHAIATGVVRQSDPAIVELSAGAFFRMLKWRDRRLNLESAQIANAMTNVFLNGICTRT